MKKKILFGFLAAVLVISLIVGWAPKAICAEKKLTKKIRLKMDMMSLPVVYGWEFLEPKGRFERIVDMLSGGMIKIDIIPGLYRTDESLYFCGDGAVPMAAQIPDYYGADMPLWGSAGLPFMYTSVDDWYVAFQQNPEVRKIWDKSYASRNLVLLGTATDTFNYLWGNKKISKIEDFKRLKIRCSGMQQMSATKALGASAVSLPFEEIAPALERHLVDAAYLPSSMIFGLKYYQILKYGNLWPLNVVTIGIFVNKDVFEALPEDAQRILREAGKYYELITWGGATNSEKAYIAALEAAGIELVRPSKAAIERARKITEVTYKKWLDKAGPDGVAMLKAAGKALGYDLIPKGYKR